VSADDQAARWAAEVSRIGELPRSEQAAAMAALIKGLAPEQRAAFEALAFQSRAHAAEMREHFEQLLRDARPDGA
jgi:hypothetical protein